MSAQAAALGPLAAALGPLKRLTKYSLQRLRRLILKENAAWENEHLGGSCPWEKGFGKLPNTLIILFIFRNVKPAFHKFGLYGGLMYTGLFYIVGRGKEPWTFKHEVLWTLFYTWDFILYFYDDLQLSWICKYGSLNVLAKIEKMVE